MWNVRVSIFGAAVCVGLWIAWSGLLMPTMIKAPSTPDALQAPGPFSCLRNSLARPKYYTNLMGPLATEWFTAQMQRSTDYESPGLNHSDTNSKTNSSSPASSLSSSLDLFSTNRSNHNRCNCLTAGAFYSSCCTRTLRGQFHKMGWVMGNQLCKEFRLRSSGDSMRIACPNRPRCLKEPSDLELLQQHDYREVLMLRNIYESLISGYLYHKSGRECWLDMNGKPFNDNDNIRPNWTNVYLWWHKHINFSLPESSPRQKGDSLCTYLARETTPPEVGMRVYIEFVFWQFYRPEAFLEQLALTNRYKSLQERTSILCFDAFVNNDQKAEHILENVIGFLFPSGHTGNYSIPELMTVIGQDHAGHSTSHDSSLRSELKNIIQQLDCEYYNGQIAFIDRNVPCGSMQ